MWKTHKTCRKTVVSWVGIQKQELEILKTKTRQKTSGQLTKHIILIKIHREEWLKSVISHKHFQFSRNGIIFCQ